MKYQVPADLDKGPLAQQEVEYFFGARAVHSQIPEHRPDRRHGQSRAFESQNDAFLRGELFGIQTHLAPRLANRFTGKLDLARSSQLFDDGVEQERRRRLLPAADAAAQIFLRHALDDHHREWRQQHRRPGEGEFEHPAQPSRDGDPFRVRRRLQALAVEHQDVAEPGVMHRADCVEQ